MESPSAINQGFSNTPQPKPDSRPGPVSDQCKSPNRLTPSGVGGRVDETSKPLGQPNADLSSSTTFDNISRNERMGVSMTSGV